MLLPGRAASLAALAAAVLRIVAPGPDYINPKVLLFAVASAAAYAIVVWAVSRRTAVLGVSGPQLSAFLLPLAQLLLAASFFLLLGVRVRCDVRSLTCLVTSPHGVFRLFSRIGSFF